MTSNEHYAFLSNIADDFPGTDEDFTPAELDRIRGTIGVISAPTETDSAFMIPGDFFPVDYDPTADDCDWITADESAAAYDGFDQFVAAL